MDYQEGKQRFIEVWGKMASCWGIPPAMARVHALLLISPEPLTAEEIKQQLDISVGSANINLRKLLSWGLISKKSVPGKRGDCFEAEKDIWTMIQKIIAYRKKKELEPVIAELEAFSQIQGDSAEAKCFHHVVSEMCKFSHRADKFLTFLITEEHLQVLHLLSRVVG
ncbi:MAG: transcriptional regulator [Saprospiraceae bacterium]|nr:transcriptional regulator [Saprospiraceae bacterium]MDW8485027.1 transcriptional regulator [Saprospiraceae bacterium]